MGIELNTHDLSTLSEGHIICASRRSCTMRYAAICLFVILLVATTGTIRSEARPVLGDLIVVTDEGGHPESCDQISVYSPDGSAVYKGNKTVSPGRIAMGSGLSFAATTSNHVRAFSLANGPKWSSGGPFWYRESARPVFGGGIALLEDRVIVGLSTPLDVEDVEERPPFYVGEHRLEASVPIPDRKVEIPAPAVEILLTKDERTAYVVTSRHEVLTLDVKTMELVGAPIQLAPLLYNARDDPDGFEWEYGRASFHNCSLSPDQTKIVCNRWADSSIVTANVVTGDTSLLSINEDGNLLRAGGVAYNHSISVPAFNGLLAVHGGSRVQVGWLRRSQFEVVAEAELEAPRIAPAGGPTFSLGWSTSGRYLTAASGDNNGFTVFEFDGSQLKVKSELTACASPDSQGPNDVGNPEMTVPYQVFLPIVFGGQCRPMHVQSDVVLVIDASSSMLEFTRSGRTKLSAAQEAAKLFISRLQDGDRVAIVSFNSAVATLIALTNDKPLLYQAVDLISTDEQTRVPLGIAAAHHLLSGAENTRAMIVLTDGRSNPEPVELAIEAASAAKSAGITVFTVGLGNEIDSSALQEIASPSAFRLAPDGDDLTDIYAGISREIPCRKETSR